MLIGWQLWLLCDNNIIYFNLATNILVTIVKRMWSKWQSSVFFFFLKFPAYDDNSKSFLLDRTYSHFAARWHNNGSNNWASMNSSTRLTFFVIKDHDKYSGSPFVHHEDLWPPTPVLGDPWTYIHYEVA